MSKSKTFRLQVNDIFDELNAENKRLYKQLLFAEKYKQLLNKFKDISNGFYKCCKCSENYLNKSVFNQLCEEYDIVLDQFEDNVQNSECLIQSNVKTEETDEDFNQNNDSNDYGLSETSDENDPQFESNISEEDINESIDNSIHLKSSCGENYSEIQRKTKNNSKIRRFVCNFNGCDTECKTESKIQVHIKTYHCRRKPITCGDCDQIFWSKQQLNKHIKCVHKEVFDKKTQKYICNQNNCKNRFKTLKQLLIHKRRHTNKKTYLCSKHFPDCQWSFFTAGELRNHQIGCHSSQLHQFVCDWIGCGQGFVIKTELDLHKLQEQHNDSEIDLQFTETPKDSFNTYIPDFSLIRNGFNSNYSVARHRNTNKMTRFICNYMFCDFKCSVKEKMERHVKELHFNKSPIDCCECDLKFWTQKLLTNHIRPNHSQLFDQSIQRFICTYNECNLSFDRYSKLLIHRKRHFEEKSFKCSEDNPNCKWSFYTIGELKNHQMWSHNGDYPYVCDWNGCQKRFKLKNLLVDHKLKHSPEDMPFKCEWPGCDYRCVRKTSLKIHRSSHEGLREFSCDWPECGQTFRTKSNLSTHFAIHTNKRKHSCDWPGCEYKSITKTSMRRHKLRHKPEGDFLCDWPQCFKRFKTKFSLLIHIRAHKGDKPFKCLSNDCDMRFTEKKQMVKHFGRKHLSKQMK